jgi:hypothetical protein
VSAASTELDEVVALLERVLPDPRAYGERLLQQVVLRWAESGGARRVVADAADPGDPPVLADVLRATRDAGTYTNADTDPDDIATDAGHDPGLADTPILLASALGACQCWGLREHCPACAGAGSSGWAEPDVDLFHEFVSPAVARLTVTLAGDRTPAEHPEREDHHERTRQGVNP